MKVLTAAGVAVAVVLGAIALNVVRAAEPATASPCLALTVEQVSAVTGEPMSEGLPTGGRTGCQWRPLDRSGPKVLVNVEPTASPSADSRSLARASGASVEDLPGSGFVASGRATHSAERATDSVVHRVLIENSTEGRAMAVSLLGLLGSAA